MLLRSLWPEVPHHERASDRSSLKRHEGDHALHAERQRDETAFDKKLETADEVQLHGNDTRAPDVVTDRPAAKVLGDQRRWR